jgi:hypothetical protein
VVPTRTGTLHIPETTLHWWNVATDKAETATIPARDIAVGPGTGVQAVVPATSASVAAAPATTTAPPVATSVTLPAGTPWRLIAAAVAALWLLTVGAWILWARRRRGGAANVPPPMPAEATRQGPAREHFSQALDRGDLVRAEHALLAWARQARPGLRNLGDLSAALQPGRQPEAIDALQRARFSNGTADAAGLRAAFKNGFDWRPVEGPGGTGGGLPPLYPR